ncbi:MAG: hypothetical protein AAFP90_21880, partial [Planctomycetota bacterium]
MRLSQILGRHFATLCIATVLTQSLLLGYFVVRGTLNRRTCTDILALLNGIDIRADRLRVALAESSEGQQPAYEEVLQQRTLAGLDIDLRLRSQQTYARQLEETEQRMRRQQQDFDRRRMAFDRRLEEIRIGVEDEGLRDLRMTLQALPADLAAEQLKRFFENGEIATVVKIVQGMRSEART